MKPQNFQIKNKAIRQKFLEMKADEPHRFMKRLNLSWSNWVFGLEELESSVSRLAKFGINFVELHGNKYGNDLGYDLTHIKKILSDYNIAVSGVCGMFSPDNDLSSNRGIVRQNAIDYIRRNARLGRELGAEYFLIVPGAVGRPGKIDEMEFDRSVETLKLVADEFINGRIKAAVEPIRSAEVSFCHTINDALSYIRSVNHPGVQHINGDVYHMLSEEHHVGEAILKAGDHLINLHIADTNRLALGEGILDLDIVIMALYIIGYNNDGCFITPEPLGPGGDPYPAMFGKPDQNMLDQLVKMTVNYFREREEQVLSL